MKVIYFLNNLIKWGFSHEQLFMSHFQSSTGGLFCFIGQFWNFTQNVLGVVYQQLVRALGSTGSVFIPSSCTIYLILLDTFVLTKMYRLIYSKLGSLHHCIPSRSPWMHIAFNNIHFLTTSSVNRFGGQLFT